MTLRYLAALALTLALVLCTAGAAAKRTAPHLPSATPPPGANLNLYSQRALRRARTILQLKLLELRAERLERVRKAIEHHVPIDELLEQNP